MNKKHCLLVISGQTREVDQAIDSIRQFIVRTQLSNPLQINILFVTWDTSYSFFPNYQYKSYINDVSTETVRSSIIDGQVITDANTFIRVVPSFQIEKIIEREAQLTLRQIEFDNEFAKVAYLNKVIFQELLHLEKNASHPFDFIIKIRPDLFINHTVSLDLSNIPDMSMYADVVRNDSIITGIHDLFLVFGRQAFEIMCCKMLDISKLDIGAHKSLSVLQEYGIEILNINELILCKHLEVVPVRPWGDAVTNYNERVDRYTEWQNILDNSALYEKYVVQQFLARDIKFIKTNKPRRAIKVIIPMAGLGSRFSEKGHDTPKPLIEFLGKPMIQHVVEHLGLTDQCEHIFLCQKEHIDKYKLHELFSTFVPHFQIIPIFGVTNGAATTVHRALTRIGPKDPILIVNSDQLVHWDKRVDNLDSDGTIFCFPGGTGPKWSYAAVDDTGRVTKVAEKVQISEHATTGMYYWKTFQQYLDAYQKMVKANDRVNNEFYVAPVYNYALDQNINIRYIHKVDQVGTPEELDEYLSKMASKTK